MWWIAIAIALVTLGYWFLVRPYKYWASKGVPQGKPIPIFGDSWGPILRQQSQAEMIQMMYNYAPTKRYCGTYQFTIPVLIINDLDLIKQITVKDFDHFLDHRTFIPDGIDGLFSKNLFALRGQQWRDMRSTLSPAFTSSKMKFMFTLISQNGEQFVNHFLKQNKDLIVVEMKDVLTRFTNDVIANTAFGIECDSLDKPTNEFYMIGIKTTDFTGFWKNLKIFAFMVAPRICKLFKLSFFSKEVGDFFKKLVKDNIISREKHAIVRPDLIHLMMEARKHGHMKYEESQTDRDAGFATVEESDVGKSQGHVKPAITDEDIAAQALVFFFAGFDSVSSLMCFLCYELGINPDIQERLRREVDETRASCKGKLTYEALAGMKYMDMVTSEALRKWPNAPGMDRVCTKPYTIEPQTADEAPVHLKQGELIFVPIFGLHRDPRYFPNPDRFDPERFSDENKDDIKPYSYLPFGAGPRNCIGSRFAILETKTLVYYILSHFEVVPVEKTKVPLKLSRKNINMTVEGGFWLGFERRTA